MGNLRTQDVRGKGVVIASNNDGDSHIKSISNEKRILPPVLAAISYSDYWPVINAVAEKWPVLIERLR
jgi:hypothetical protein